MQFKGNAGYKPVRRAFTGVAALLLTTGIAVADELIEDAKKTVEEGYAGLYEAPPESGPAAVEGKSIWYISCGQAFVACSQHAEGFAEAAEHLGWTVSIQDGRATPSVASDLIRQAVAAKADAITFVAFDCPGIKSALLLAKEEKIPVIASQSIDCSAEIFGGEEALFTAGVSLMGSADARDYYRKFGELRAKYILAKTEGKANIVSIGETSQVIQQTNHEGFMDTIAKCGDCVVNESLFNFGQVPSPATQIWQSALLQNPDANVVEFGIDALMVLGLQTAVKQANKGASTGVVVGGGEGFPPNYDLIREGTQTFSVAMPYNWFGWATADTVNRILAGEDAGSLPSQGTGFQYVDAEHNLPEPGKSLEPSFDYKKSYLSVWGGS